VAFHFVTALGYSPLLFLDLLGLFGESGGGGVDLPGRFVDLGLATLEPGFSLQERSLHFRKLALVINELLAEGGHGQALILASFVQGDFLLPEMLGFEPNLGANVLQIILSLMGISVKLGEVFAQLLACFGELLRAGAGLLLQVGELFLQSNYFLA
jgi:hypothetical protein